MLQSATVFSVSYGQCSLRLECVSAASEVPGTSLGQVQRITGSACAAFRFPGSRVTRAKYSILLKTVKCNSLGVFIKRGLRSQLGNISFSTVREIVLFLDAYTVFNTIANSCSV